MRNAHIVAKLLAEIGRLEQRLADAEETLNAIRSGEVDGFVVSNSTGNSIYTVPGAEHPYRQLVENMNEGAAIVSREGTVLFCNARLAELLGLPADEINGKPLSRNIIEADHLPFDNLIASPLERARAEITLKGAKDVPVPTLMSVGSLEVYQIPAVCIVVTDLSDRKRAEEAVRQQALMLSISFDAILLRTQKDSIITYWNRGAEELYGYSASEAIGRISNDLLGTSEEPEAVDVFESVETGVSWRGIIEHRTKSGRKVWVESRHQIVQENDGQGLVLETNRDVTERILAEQSLRRVNRALRILSQANKSLTRLTDESQLLEEICRSIVEGGQYRAARVAFVDESGLKTFRLAAQAYSTDELNDLNGHWWSSEQSTSVPAELAVRTGGRYVVHYSLDRSSGVTWQPNAIREGLCACLAFPLVIGQQPQGALCLYVADTDWQLAPEEVGLLEDLAADISFGVETLRRRQEHKRAEEALRESERLSRLVLDSAPLLVFAFDQSGTVMLVDGSGLAKLNLYQEELLGRSVYDIVSDNKEVLAAVERALSGERFNITLPFAHHFLDTWYSPVRGADQKVAGVIGVAVDVTERVNAEEALSLKDEQLIQSQKMEAIGRLAGGVAHDFNNLLTAILGFSDLTLMRLEGTDPLRDHVEEVKKAGKRAAALTRQLLAFSRRQVMQPKLFDLNNTIEELAKMLGRLIGEDIDLRLSLQPQPAFIHADQSQIEQVVLNLVVNARDAMPAGGRIIIETANVELDEWHAQEHAAVTTGPYVMLAVSDTGVGIDKDVRNRIFEPFFTTKAPGKGTGLGLATVYGIVKQSGGSIWVYSEPGLGTTFKTYLPLHVEDGADGRSAPSMARPLEGHETILLVEDEKAVADVACETLQMYGYRVLKVADGREALELAQKHEGPIHLLLTDVVMPLMNGREVAEQIKVMRPETKILFMSGYTETAIVHNQVLENGIDMLEKPFSPTALSRKVREILDRPRLAELKSSMPVHVG